MLLVLAFRLRSLRADLLSSKPKPSSQSPRLPMRIGCPVWSCDDWSEIVYPARTAKSDKLAWYSSMFNTVEGNNSFYAIPSEDHALRWARTAAEGFQFCMKFPREISHERSLIGAHAATDDFLRVLYVLAEHDRAGPAFLQLGPDFSPRQFAALEAYLRGLPTDLGWAVEVRHFDWFDSGPNEARLLELLKELNIDQCLFDSRPLYQSPPDDEIERASQGRKPKSPLRRNVTAKRPMLRIVGRNRIELVHSFIDDWLPTLRQWIDQGLEPIVFTHAPDDRYAPEFARELWRRFLALEAPNSKTFDDLPRPPAKPQQLGFAFE